MALELVGSRILAPFLGTSIFVWTSLIGVILASLSAGYWWGGIVADKDPSYKKLSSVIYPAGILIGLTAAANSVILYPISISGLGPKAGSIIATLFLFAPAAVLFGMVSPIAAKIKLNDLNCLGKDIGSLYALSTVGSILGTFAGGFYLISVFGSSLTLAIIALLTIFAAFIAYPGLKNIPSKIVPVTFIALCVFAVEIAKSSDETFRDIDTDYKRIWIVDKTDPKSNRPIRYLIDAPFGAQSEMFLDSNIELAAIYTKYYDLYKFFAPKSRHTLMLGGGAYSFPKYFIETNKTAQMDVVEIDPELTELARQYFNLKDDPRMTLYSDDARVFLNKTNKKYDAIFVDVFTATLSIPFHVITKEAIEKEYELLNEKGAVFTNIIAAIEGNKGKYFRAVFATYKNIFPQVYAFPIDVPDNGSATQNIMLVALKSPVLHPLTSTDAELQTYLSHLWTKEIPEDSGIFTDDFAPVEKYAEEMI